ncbi:MAG: AI-2E family transporter [Propionibacterium sp.]
MAKDAEQADAESGRPTEPVAPARPVQTRPQGEGPVPQGPFRGQPHWLPRLTVIMFAMAGVAGTLWTFQQLSWLLAPAFFGVNLVIAAYPIYAFLTRRHLPSWLAGLVMGLALIAAMALLGLAMVWAISTLVNAVPGYVPRFAALYEELRRVLAEHHINADPMSSASNYFDSAHIISVLSGLVGSISGTVGAATVTFTMMLMVLIDSMGWSDRMKMATDSHPRVAHAMVGFARGTRRYWLASTLFGLIMAALNGIALKIFGVPLMGVWMILTFITTYVPTVGFFFAMVPPVLVALLVNGWQNALWLMVVYFITTWVVQGYFQPKVTGNAVGVNITVSFLSLLFWAWVFGPLGAIIALPATQLVKSLVIDADPKSRWVNAFFATEPDLRDADPQT